MALPPFSTSTIPATLHDLSGLAQDAFTIPNIAHRALVKDVWIDPTDVFKGLLAILSRAVYILTG
jgi:hypothetical protein